MDFIKIKYFYSSKENEDKFQTRRKKLYLIKDLLYITLKTQ